MDQIVGDAGLEIPDKYCIYETEHWLVNHRINSALPGYLMLGAKTSTDDLSELSDQALMALGPLMAITQEVLRSVMKPNRSYIGRFGHSPGYPFHFHLIPIYDWVERAFWQDAQYRTLGEFSTPPGCAETDGAELTFFVWREFCESRTPPASQGPSIEMSIAMLRKEMSCRLEA